MKNDLAQQIGPGVQLFRIRHAKRYFDEVADLGPLHEVTIGRRRVWKLKGTDAFFALLTIPYQDEEEILVKVDNPDWSSWDWKQLADIADGCRWRGPAIDKRWIN